MSAETWSRWLLVGSLLCALGCEAKAGAPCKPEGKEVCGSKSSALLCLDQKWMVMQCRGQDGCDEPEGQIAHCDQSVARVGEVCHLEGALTCAEDKRSSLLCKNNAWVASERCGGPLACVPAKPGVSGAICDASIAREHDRCSVQDTQACSSDKRARLTCNGGRFKITEFCRGPAGCSSKERKVSCDNSRAVVGEPCDMPENYACSTDFRSILVCRDNKYVIDTRCRHNTSCHVEGSKVGCIE